MLLSIIIPCYNVEKFLSKCIFSCLNQDLSKDKYEIIIINDGSPDNCLSIAKSFLTITNNIIIIDQENQGLSGARNTGIQYANGKYLWFVDSDDYIEENCLGFISSYLIKEIDILQLQYRLVYEDTTLSIDAPKISFDEIITGVEAIRKGGLPAPIQFCIYRADFLKEYELKFVRGIYHEDCEFKPRATYYANKIQTIDNICYNYLQRNSGSITSKFRIKNAEDLLFVINNLRNFSRKLPINVKLYFNQIISTNINSLIYGIQDLSNNDRCKILEMIKQQKYIFKNMIFSAKLKYILEGILLFFNLKLGIRLYLYIKRL